MLKNKRKCILNSILVSLLISVLLFSGCGQNTGSQEGAENKTDKFPNKPVTLIVPYDAGGGSDLTSRMVASIAEKELGVPVTIVNMPGGSGATGYAELRNREADGYTILSCTSTIETMKLLGVLDFNHEAFDIVSGFNYEPAAIAVNAKIAEEKGWNTFADFIEYCKQHPGDVSMGTSAVGGIWNIGTLAAQSAIGVEWNVIPAGGGGAQPIVQAAGGQIEAVTAGTLEVYNQVEAGTLKVLGIMSDERLDTYPDAETLKENGYDVSITTTRSILAPKGVPQERLEVLYQAFSKASSSDEYKEYCTSKGAGYLSDNGEDMMKFYDEQKEVFSKVIVK
ncbi:MAG: tripartite tricarboxylate transporter substrate binding protein [Dehalobacterium sp.]|jgi:tripartite-type tricarboxylate transporter receptor subunit TctC